MYDSDNKVMIVPNEERGNTSYVAFAMVREEEIVPPSTPPDREQAPEVEPVVDDQMAIPIANSMLNAQSLTWEQVYAQLRQFTSNVYTRSVKGLVRDKSSLP